MCSGSVDADNIRANQGLNGVAITGKLDFHFMQHQRSCLSCTLSINKRNR